MQKAWCNDSRLNFLFKIFPRTGFCARTLKMDLTGCFGTILNVGAQSLRSWEGLERIIQSGGVVLGFVPKCHSITQNTVFLGLILGSKWLFEWNLIGNTH